MASSHGNPQDLRAATRARLPRATTYPLSTVRNRFGHTSYIQNGFETLRCGAEQDGACVSPSSSLYARPVVVRWNETTGSSLPLEYYQSNCPMELQKEQLSAQWRQLRKKSEGESKC